MRWTIGEWKLGHCLMRLLACNLLGDDSTVMRLYDRRFLDFREKMHLFSRCFCNGATADSYLGFIHIASIRLWMREFVNAS